MTFEEEIKQMLIASGFFPDEAAEVIANAKEAKMFSSMQGRWYDLVRFLFAAEARRIRGEPQCPETLNSALAKRRVTLTIVGLGRLKTLVRLSQSAYELLTQRAKRQHRTRSALARILIEDGLQKNAQEKGENQ